MISFQTLLKVAPFNAETRAKLDLNMSSLSEDQKFKLTQIAWSMLAALYQAKLNKEFELELLDVREGKKQYDENIREKIEGKLLHELAQKLELSGTEEEIEEVKKSIEQFKTSSS